MQQLFSKPGEKKAIDGYQSEKLGFALQRLLIKDFGGSDSGCQLFVDVCLEFRSNPVV